MLSSVVRCPAKAVLGSRLRWTTLNRLQNDFKFTKESLRVPQQEKNNLIFLETCIPSDAIRKRLALIEELYQGGLARRRRRLRREEIGCIVRRWSVQQVDSRWESDGWERTHGEGHPTFSKLECEAFGGCRPCVRDRWQHRPPPPCRPKEVCLTVHYPMFSEKWPSQDPHLWLTKGLEEGQLVSTERKLERFGPRSCKSPNFS